MHEANLQVKLSPSRLRCFGRSKAANGSGITKRVCRAIIFTVVADGRAWRLLGTQRTKNDLAQTFSLTGNLTMLPLGRQELGKAFYHPTMETSDSRHEKKQSQRPNPDLRGLVA
jgi:hypothetical protein